MTFDDLKPLIGALEGAGLPILEMGLTAAVSTVAGPVAFLVKPTIDFIVPAMNAILGIPATASPAQTAEAVSKATPDQIDALKALQENDAFKLASTRDQQAFDLAMSRDQRAFDMQSQTQQLAVSTAEISNPSLFIGGWRPAICWGLGGLLLTFKALPIPVYVLNSCGMHLGVPPDMDFGTFTLVSSLLGVAIGFRSLDKHLGNDTAAIGGTSTVMVKKAARK